MTPNYKTIDYIENIETRFKDVAGLVGDVSRFPITKDTHMQTATDKSKSDTFGEVFTPLWLVDEMIERISDYDWRNGDKSTLDLCAGYGQFSIRMIRKKYDLLGDTFKLGTFFGKTHSFAEYQFSSVYKILYIFSYGVNIFIGDAKRLSELSEDAKGCMYYSEVLNKWLDINPEVRNILKKRRVKYNQEVCDTFVTNLKKIIKIKEGKL